MTSSGYAVTVCREAGRWHCDLLPPAVLTDLDNCVAAVRQQISEGGPLALMNVEDEFFIAIRVMPDTSIRLLLSDATAALDWDVAAQAVDFLEVDVPEDEELWPTGDMDLLTDLGLPADELRLIVDDVDLYADEMLALIADRVGFAEELSQVTGRRDG